MKVVADSGPLIAFAKIGGLDTLFGVYPLILSPRAVFDETVNEGEHLQAPDAALLRAEYENGRIRVEEPQGTPPSGTRFLGRGERASIQLAVQQDADWLLADDLEARHAAVREFAASEARTRVKGTLGIITSSFLGGSTSLQSALQLLEAIRFRKDIWISAELCQQVEGALRRLAEASAGK